MQALGLLSDNEKKMKKQIFWASVIVLAAANAWAASEEDVALFLHSYKQTLENQDMDFVNRIQAWIDDLRKEKLILR